jgi:hypothetical protein
MKILLKRDTTSESFPHPDQLDTGELVINAVTGKMYTKLVSGKVVEFISQDICYEPSPEIYLEYKTVRAQDQIKEFCCSGDSIIYIVRNLKTTPKEYSFSLIELTNNNSEIILANPQYSNYTETIVENDISTDINLRQAIIPLEIIINQVSNISMFKFIVKSEGKTLAEDLITISCEDTLNN